MDAFLLGLADYVKDELVSYDLPASLDDIIELASRVDDRFKLDTEKDSRDEGNGFLLLQLLPDN